jgi:predicted short-subunit dehydrogenase-like oxidoreductase (DUF2520 family)
VKALNIILIGSGNVATQLGLALKKSGHNIVQVYSRTNGTARALALKLRAQPITRLKQLSDKADLYIIAIKDDAVPKLIQQLTLKKKFVVHTSGSLPMNILKRVSSNYGVLYPLQTLSKSKTISFSTVPLCIEANTKANEKQLNTIAHAISKQVHSVNSEKRKVLHLAAVFACNFTNHMYAIANKLLGKNKLPFELLLPLIQETADKVKHGSPVQMQTGPAARNDKSIMKMHLNMLSKEKRTKKLYKSISQSITHI